MLDIDVVRSIIQNANNIVFFGGAGVSTASGIPDYRSSNGLYSSKKDEPEYYLSSACLTCDTQEFYKFYRNNMVHLDAEPNNAHIALADLENKHNKNVTIITQNIDGLHQKSGSKSVIEIHGSVYNNYCTGCGKSYDVEAIVSTDKLPRCTVCNNLIRPGVILYGEVLDKEKIEMAKFVIRNSDLLIIGGTSLSVQPAASLIQEYRGKNIIVINHQEIEINPVHSNVIIIRDNITDALKLLTNFNQEC